MWEIHKRMFRDQRKGGKSRNKVKLMKMGLGLEEQTS